MGAADGRNAPPLFTLAQVRLAAVLAFLRGQSHRDDDREPEMPPPDEIDRIVRDVS